MADYSLEDLIAEIREFAAKRDWLEVHNPKNLAMALTVEAGELMEHFQWLDLEESLNLDEKIKHEVSLEMADVLIYLCRMSDRLGIDLLAAARKKIVLNGEKYPLPAGKK